MEIAILPSTSLVPDRRVRQVRPLSEQLARTSEQAEPVLQGELLSRDRPGAQITTRPASEYLNARREDHPAFQERFENETFQQRQAIDSYSGVDRVGGGSVSHTVDILV